jgi:hypothetical protein
MILYPFSKYLLMTDSSKIKHFEYKKIYLKFKTEKVQYITVLHLRILDEFIIDNSL